MNLTKKDKISITLLTLLLIVSAIILATPGFSTAYKAVVVGNMGLYPLLTVGAIKRRHLNGR